MIQWPTYDRPHLERSQPYNLWSFLSYQTDWFNDALGIDRVERSLSSNFMAWFYLSRYRSTMWYIIEKVTVVALERERESKILYNRSLSLIPGANIWIQYMHRITCVSSRENLDGKRRLCITSVSYKENIEDKRMSKLSQNWNWHNWKPCR